MAEELGCVSPAGLPGGEEGKAATTGDGFSGLSGIVGMAGVSDRSSVITPPFPSASPPAPLLA